MLDIYVWILGLKTILNKNHELKIMIQSYKKFKTNFDQVNSKHNK